MPLRKFPNSDYWYFEGRDLNGKRYCVSTKQKQRAAAARAGRAIELARAVPRLPRYTLSAALVALAAHKARKRVSEAERQIVRTKGGRLIAHFGPALDVHELGPTSIDGYVDARRRAEVRPGKKLSDGTIAMELRVLREALRVAKRAGHYSGDPDALRPTVLAPYKPRERWLTFEQFDALVRELQKRSAHRVDYVLIWCHTGIRYGELHRLTGADLDRRGRRLFVRGKKGSREHRERWVPLSDAAFEVLDRRARAAGSVNALLFKPWLKPNVRLTLERACRRAGMPAVTPNDFRRSYVTWHLTAGTTERETQRYVGHSPKSTLVRRVYGQLAADAGRGAVAGFPAPPSPSEVSQGVSQTA